MNYTLWDLFSVIGKISLIDISIWALNVIILYILIMVYLKVWDKIEWYLKDFIEFRKAYNKSRPKLSDKGIQMILEEHKAKSNSNTSIRIKQPSTDRKTNPKLFEDLHDTIWNLRDEIWIKQLSLKIWVSTTTIYDICKNIITTKSTARKYLKLAKVISKELDKQENQLDIEQTDEIKELNSRYWLADENELKELNLLIDLALDKMTQNELALRMDIPQVYVSNMNTRKIVKRDQVLSYIGKLKWIVHLTQG